MSVVDIDREERRSAREAALRAGEDLHEHQQDCLCRSCAREATWGEEV